MQEKIVEKELCACNYPSECLGDAELAGGRIFQLLDVLRRDDDEVLDAHTDAREAEKLVGVLIVLRSVFETNRCLDTVSQFPKRRVNKNIHEWPNRLEENQGIRKSEVEIDQQLLHVYSTLAV